MTALKRFAAALPGLDTVLARAKVYAGLVKIEHSVFALPFAYVGLFLAKRGWPGLKPFLLLTVAMVAVRSWAMGVNRLLDLRYDRHNPRTQGRELVRGALGVTEGWAFVCACAAVFVAACWGMNPLCLALAPFALIWSGFYSFTKRFTWMCHLVLGSVLGLAPMAGWLAVTPQFSLPMALFGLGVSCWVAGFDVLYSCQDVDFDRKHGLWSMPARFGVGNALSMAGLLHGNAVLLFALAGWGAALGWGYFGFLLATGALLWVEHRLISENDLSRIDMAFFTINGVVAASLFVGVLVDLFVLG
ncbi:4-hydroxybenzoate octaprenyltransferase [Fundidesulfovibrio agrisoli]|uniref:4-hydroxybenzoate octaprenyltransferase n=1 Tax=Fundidesulfovibrio agrisoli TaxID=2922717 RepID=UPI001FAC5C20|nr:4-hydroxybenzoate octaprenyltransferase [Fundidesulfovibrio agrisoli]